MKSRYEGKATLYYMDTNSFLYIKRKNLQRDWKDVETRFDTSNFELDRPLTKGNSKKIIGLMKDEWRG